MRIFIEHTLGDVFYCLSHHLLNMERNRWVCVFFSLFTRLWNFVIWGSNHYMTIGSHHVDIFGWVITSRCGGSLIAPFSLNDVESWAMFFPCGNGFFGTTGYYCANRFYASTSRGHRLVGWYYVKRLHRYFIFILSDLHLPTLLLASLSPLPFLFHCLFFPSGWWFAFGFIECTLFMFDVWVGGIAEPEVWLDAIYCINNFWNLFDNRSIEFTCVEPKIPSAWGPNFFLALLRMDHGASRKIS